MWQVFLLTCRRYSVIWFLPVSSFLFCPVYNSGSVSWYEDSAWKGFSPMCPDRKECLVLSLVSFLVLCWKILQYIGLINRHLHIPRSDGPFQSPAGVTGRSALPALHKRLMDWKSRLSVFGLSHMQSVSVISLMKVHQKCCYHCITYLEILSDPCYSLSSYNSFASWYRFRFI